MTSSTKNHSLSLCFSIMLSSSLFDLITSQSDYNPTDMIFLNCGGTTNSTDSDGRKWTSDIGSNYAFSTTATAAVQKPSVPEVPYMTARIFRSESTYSFPVTPGRKFIRLYFYPASYNGLDSSNALFSVKSGPYILLRNFSAKQTGEALNYDYTVKEFSVNVQSNVLNITFKPSENSSNTFGFVNGIEILSHPDIYSTQRITPVVDNSTALENVYRLNVGGNTILPSSDTGLFRSWADDISYIFSAATGVTEVRNLNVTIGYPWGSPSYMAPLKVYESLRSMGPTASINQNFNLTWVFRVDSGFSYLIRLHFCEITGLVRKVNQRVFTIFLNNQTAEKEMDVISSAGRDGVPVHRDYVVFVPPGPAQQDFWVDLHPYIASKPQYCDAILNGLEIFKINDSKGNLAGLNPVRPSKPEANPSSNSQSVKSSKSHKAAIGEGVGGGIATVLIVVIVLRLVYGYKKEKNVSLYGHSLSSLTSNHCRHFSINEIKAATNNFDEALLIGHGGFGKVYRGEIDVETKVAIKRGNPLSEQGVHEFRTEIEMLSKLRHMHLVSLIGYCDDNCEMILVYGYMANGTLREHLYRTEKPTLPWKKRLEICIGAARGLHYLHTGAKHTIIHRDVKTTNILLDENFVAKVSDFGLSKTGPMLDHTHVTTVVKGSFGYLDPEYFKRQKLTEKSDVYSYGVVLFEALCARPALCPTLPKEQVSLAEWAQHCCQKGLLDQIVDPYLKGKIGPDCFNRFVDIAMKCVSDVGIERPSMGDVLWNLEIAKKLQESVEEKSSAVRCKGTNGLHLSHWFDGTDSKIGLAGEVLDASSPIDVFSEIMNPQGR